MVIPVRGGLTAAITITPAYLTQTYDGSAKSVTATTEPAGLTTKISYAGSSTAPTDAGTYPVLLTVTDPNYLGQASGNLVITKTNGSVAIDASSLSQTWDGTPKSVTTTANPAGAAVTVTYAGSSTAPTEPGSYQVDASMVNYTGTDTGTLTIAKATPVIVWPPPDPIPAGRPLTAAQFNTGANVPAADTTRHSARMPTATRCCMADW